MSDLFRPYAATAAGVIDNVFGESFAVFPMAFANGRYSADQTRAGQIVRGVFSEKALFSDPVGQRNAGGMSKNIVAEHATTTATIDIKKSAIPYVLRDKDRLQRVADGVYFEVSGVLNDDLDHVSYRVVDLGSQ